MNGNNPLQKQALNIKLIRKAIPALYNKSFLLHSPAEGQEYFLLQRPKIMNFTRSPTVEQHNYSCEPNNTKAMNSLKIFNGYKPKIQRHQFFSNSYHNYSILETILYHLNEFFPKGHDEFPLP